jgi:hypothetical protein
MKDWNQYLANLHTWWNLKGNINEQRGGGLSQLLELGIWLDQMLNTLTGGDPRSTLSLRWNRDAAKKGPARIPNALANFFFHKDGPWDHGQGEYLELSPWGQVLSTAFWLSVIGYTIFSIIRWIYA